MTIEYTTASWNPLVGCLPVSPGCAHCFAARDAATRLAHVPAYEGTTRRRDTLAERLGAKPADDDHAMHYAFNGDLRVREEKMDEPLRKQRPQRYFVCSTSDMFYNGVPQSARDRMMAVMLLSPWHTYLITTKRSQEAYEYLHGPLLYQRILKEADRLREQRPGLLCVPVSDPMAMAAPWIWFGVSAERPKEFHERVYWLRKLPAAKRWVSLSPLLEEIAFDHGELREIDWVVMEGESGPDARQSTVGAFSRMSLCCNKLGVPVYLKQLGDHVWDEEIGGLLSAGRGGRNEDKWPDSLQGLKQYPKFWAPDLASQMHFPSMARARKAKIR